MELRRREADAPDRAHDPRGCHGTTSTRTRLVEPSGLEAEFAAITATIPRDEIEAALSSDLPAELFLDVKQPSGEADAEERR